MEKRRILLITQTAVMLALLIGIQLLMTSIFGAPVPLYGQLITGSAVNLILLVSVFFVGLPGGLIIALLSPVLAFFVGIQPPVPQMLIVIPIGNAVFVLIAWLAEKQISLKNTKDFLISILTLSVASITKFLILWLGIVKIMIPLMSDIAAPKVKAITLAFSWPQIITALIASALALTIVPILKRVIKT